MKIIIGIDNQDRKTIIQIKSEHDLLREDFQELKECLSNIFRCNCNEININIIEL